MAVTSMIGSQIFYGRGCSCCNAQGHNKKARHAVKRSIRRSEERAWRRDFDADAR